MDNVDKVVGILGRLQVYGTFEITNYVEFFTNHRHCRAAKRREIDAF